MNPNIVDVTMENAQQVLVEESQKRLVVIDFWADWSEPCKSLVPIMEKLAGEYDGQFLLAKVNADELQQLAAQLGVQSLPTVMLMQDGKTADGFQGLQTETAIREMLEKYLPAPWQGMVDQANTLIAEGNFNDALGLLRQAYQMSMDKPELGVGLAQIYLHLNRCDEAEALLAKIKMADQDAAYEQAMATLQLKRDASTSPELKALEQQWQSEPENLSVAYHLAVQYSQNNQAREALELLITVLRKDMNLEEGAAKKTMLDMLASLGKGDPLALEYQRKLFALLY